jgi:thiol-disulfide isomerase/thioredoxin
MKYFLLIVLVALSLSCRPAAAPVAVSNRPASINNIPQANESLSRAADIGGMGWQTFDGKSKTLGDLKGKIVVVDFWATYCPPCIEEIPHLNELQNRGGDIQVVGLNVGGDDDKPKIPDFVRRLNIQYELGYPGDDLISAMLGTDDRIPQTFVLDRNGKVIQAIVGFDDGKKQVLDVAVETALKN